MNHKSINVSEEIKNILPDTLEKDLQENEEICPVCHGLGVVIDNNVYGIRDDTSEAAKKSMFPYNHQALRLCPNCFNGVIKLCKYCGKPLKDRHTIECDCEEYKFREDIAASVRYSDKINSAKEIQLEDITTDVWFYDEDTDKYFPDIDSFVAYYENNNNYETVEELENYLPEVLWFTEETSIQINAGNIIEDACEELHEDAYDSISTLDIQKLQKVLDKWCEEQTGTKTYYPDYNKYIKVKKEWFEQIT